MISSDLFILFCAALVTIVLVLWISPIAVRFGLVDLPDERRRHSAATPLCGGLAIFAALGVVGILRPDAVAASPAAIAGVLVVLFIGVIDDRWRLPALLRLGAQVVVSCLLVMSSAFFAPDLGELVTKVPVSFASLVLGSLLCIGLIAGLVNSMNMLDGVDGLAGAVALTAFFWLSATAQALDHADVARLSEMLMAATAGFLFFNLRHAWRPRALVFLGDGGSTALGAAIAYLMLVLSHGATSAPLPGLLWMAAIPIIDTVSLIVRRMAARRSPFAADREHTHHLLLDLGLSPGAVTATIAAASFMCGAIGYTGIVWQIPTVWLLLGLALPVAAHCAVVLAARDLSQPGGARLLRVLRLTLRRSEDVDLPEPIASHADR